MKRYEYADANRFLPWFPMKTMEEAKDFYEGRLVRAYGQGRAHHYAVCLKTDHIPIGYINTGADESHDFGYGMRREFWQKGYMTEAGTAVVELLRKEEIPYITATHDVSNPRSGGVMRRLGMRYRYSYEEQWQPKDIPVIFRMYQLNLDGNDSRIYMGYWERSAVHFVERETEILQKKEK